MDRTVDIEGIRQQLKGIVALLLSFAAIADRVCVLPHPARASVMAFLVPAEAIAWEFVAGEAGLQSSPHGQDEAEDAAWLAARFRALAVALAGVACRLAIVHRVSPHVRPARVVRIAADFAVRMRGELPAAPKPFDTS